MDLTICFFPSCKQKIHNQKHGLCRTHVEQLYKTGKVFAFKPKKKYISYKDNLLNKNMEIK